MRDDLVDAHAGGVDLDRVVGLAQRVGRAAGVELVAPFQVGAGGRDVGGVLGAAALGAGGGR